MYCMYLQLYSRFCQVLHMHQMARKLIDCKVFFLNHLRREQGGTRFPHQQAQLYINVLQYATPVMHSHISLNCRYRSVILATRTSQQYLLTTLDIQLKADQVACDRNPVKIVNKYAQRTVYTTNNISAEAYICVQNTNI